MNKNVFGPDVVSDTQELGQPDQGNTPPPIRKIIEEGANHNNAAATERMHAGRPIWKTRFIGASVGAVIMAFSLGIAYLVDSSRSGGSETSSAFAASTTNVAAGSEKIVADTPAVKTDAPVAMADEEVVMNFEPELSLEVVHSDLVNLHESLAKDFQPFVQKLSVRTDTLETELASFRKDSYDLFVRQMLVVLVMIFTAILCYFWIEIRKLKKALVRSAASSGDLEDL